MITNSLCTGMGLCNRLFYLAALISYKKQHPKSEIFCHGDQNIMWARGLCLRDIRDIYGSDDLRFISDSVVDTSKFKPVVLNMDSFAVDYNYDVEFTGAFWVIKGFVNKYIDRNDIVRIFKPQHLVDTVTNKFKSAFINSYTKIGLSVRRGDFVKLNADWIRNFFKDNNDLKHYEHRIREIASKESNPLIVVVSDDIHWCRENLSSLHPNMEFIDTRDEKYKAIYDLTVLGMCKHVIMTPGSTFSQWGHILSTDGYMNYYSHEWM